MIFAIKRSHVWNVLFAGFCERPGGRAQSKLSHFSSRWSWGWCQQKGLYANEYDCMLHVFSEPHSQESVLELQHIRLSSFSFLVCAFIPCSLLIKQSCYFQHPVFGQSLSLFCPPWFQVAWVNSSCLHTRALGSAQFPISHALPGVVCSVLLITDWRPMSFPSITSIPRTNQHLGF